MATCLQMSLQKDMLTCWTHTHTQAVLQASLVSIELFTHFARSLSLLSSFFLPMF